MVFQLPQSAYKLVATLTMGLLPLFLWAQGTVEKDDPLHHTWQAASQFTTIALPGVEPLQEVDSWLTQTFGNTYQLTNQTQSLVGYHLRYEQVWQGYPIAYSEVKVNLDNNRHIVSHFSTLFSTYGWPAQPLVAEMEQLPETAIISSLATQYPGIVHDHRKVWYFDSSTETPYAALQCKIEGTDGVLYELIAHPTQGILLERDIRHFYRQANDTLVDLTVFMPDPLTSAQQNYGGLYSDINDADSPALNNEREVKPARVRFSNGVFSLSGYNLEMADLRPPSVAPPTSMQPVFDFTRGQDAFEYVNTYYHLSVFQQYMASLGFSNITSFVLEVDALGTTDDNSYFATTTPPRIILGTGGVDDAEDADVIIHEYGHAISYSVSPNTNSGFERQALDEGFGDYLAASYSRGLSEFRWGEVYTWDGHNEYWPGRTAVNNKQYPEDLSNNFYLGGEIWAAALMEAWPILGKENMDRLVIQMMYSTASNISLREAAQLLLQAESQLYNGQYQDDLFLILANRGLIESFETSIAGTSEFIRGVGRPTVYLSSEEEQATVEVYNTGGQLVGQRLITDQVTTLPNHWFPVAGIYLVRLRLDSGQIAEKTVLVQP